MSESKLYVAVELGGKDLMAVAATRSDEGVLHIVADEVIDINESGAIRYGMVKKPGVVLSNLNAVLSRLDRMLAEKTCMFKDYDLALYGYTISTADSIKRLRLQMKSRKLFTADSEKMCREKILENHQRSGRDIVDVEFYGFTLDNKRYENPISVSCKDIECEYLALESGEAFAEGYKQLSAREELKRWNMHNRVVLKAMGDAFLTAEEKKERVVLIDFGHQCTSLAVYRDGKMRYMHTIPLGGDAVSADLQQLLSITHAEAETLKCTIGVDAGGADAGVTYGVKKVSRAQVVEYAVARVDEVLDLVEQALATQGFEGLLAEQVVITGAALNIAGLVDYLEKKKQWNVKCVDLHRYIDAGQAEGRDSLEAKARLIALLLTSQVGNEIQVKGKTSENRKKNVGIWRSLFEGMES